VATSPGRARTSRGGRLAASHTTLITGGALLDQSWHRGWLAVSALTTTLVGQPRGAAGR
jgi:hypothetical protein